MYLLDESGTVLNELIAGDTVIINADKSEFKEVNRGRTYVKVYTEAAAKMSKVLTAPEIVVAFRLVPYVWANSGILKTRNGRFMTRQYFLNENSDLSRSQIDRCFNSLVSKGVLAKAVTQGKKAYIVNPYIFQVGTKCERVLCDLFKHTQWVEGGGGRNG